MLDAEHLCFVNSESVPLAEGWLAALAAAVREPGVGAVGATGSYEATRSRLPLRRRRWPAFPNPHLRTNAFMISSEVMRDLRWPDVTSKREAWELESGWRGMTRQLWYRGLQTLVVGRDHRAYSRSTGPRARRSAAATRRISSSPTTALASGKPPIRPSATASAASRGETIPWRRPRPLRPVDEPRSPPR